MSSFNLASLIAGTSGTPKPQVQVQDVKPSGKTQKSFTHGINVIFNGGTFKGHHGSVSDFYPASINLMTSGKAYIEAGKYGPIVQPGTMLFTDIGKSLVEQVLPSIGGQYVPIQLFKSRTDNQLRVGRVIDNANIITRSLLKQGKGLEEIQMMMENRNNHFLFELSLFDTSLISNMSDLNISGNEADILADQLTKMQINSETPAPLEQLSQEVKTNTSLLDKIIHPEYFEDDIEVKVVFKRDLVGPQYYLNVSGNLGDIKMFNPNKTHYLVSYTRPVELKPSMVTIEKEALKPGEVAFQIKHEKSSYIGSTKEVKMTRQQIEKQEKSNQFKYIGSVTSGPYKGQRLEVVGYQPAHLDIILSTTGRKVSDHLIRKRTDKGDFIIDEYNNPVFEKSLIHPSHIFYFDLLLKNGNYAQVNKILSDDKISVTEKDSETRKYKKSEINMSDIQNIQPGFKFNEKDVPIKTEEEIMIVSGPTEVSEEEQEVFEEEDSDSQEIDYATSPVGEVDDEEQPQKASFKDTQRTFVEQRELNAQEKRLKDEIAGVLKLLKVHEDSIDVYVTIDNINSLIKNISNKLKSVDYTTDLYVTSNIKFIITCIVLYELVRTGFNKNLDTVVSILFPNYFTIKDIQAQNMNENIFLLKWSDALSQERIDESVNKIREYRKTESNYPKIIKELMINADIVLQGLLGLHINIVDRSPVKLEDLIPVGVNPVTGRRFKDEELEKSMIRQREASIKLRNEMVTVEDLISGKTLPVVEVPIVWSQINMPIIEKFKQSIQQKADNQSPELRQDYIYIRDNFNRAPFAIRDDPMKAAVRKAFEGMYKTLLSHIIQQNLKIEKGKKRMREEQEQININRAKIMASKPQEQEDEDDFEPQHTRSYLKEQQKRETQRSIAKATRAANRTAYMMKKQRQNEPSESSEQMDTSE